MLSDKLKTLSKTMELLGDPASMTAPPRPLLLMIANQLRDCCEQARQMEQVAVPRRQRLQESHLRNSNVALFPRAPRNEAFT